MSKTPVSILQEYLMKTNKPIPIYNCLGDRQVGTNDHEFLMRVTSGDFSADGKGPTKKEAKHNAAKEMLILIGGVGAAAVSVNSKLCNMGVQQNSSIETDGSPLPNSGTNYIGLLHEYCAQWSIKAPTFLDVNATGPSHLMTFTIRCQVADIEEEASAKTKKQAKTEAARKVWIKLSGRRFDHDINGTVGEMMKEAGVEITDLKLEEILPDYKAEHEIAEKKYVSLTKLKTTNLISDKIMLEDVHRVFTSQAYSIPLRRSIIALLGEMDPQKEDVRLLPKCKSTLDQVAKLMNVRLDRIPFVQRQITNSEFAKNLNYTVGFRLHTEPKLVSICSAETAALAELKAIFDVAFNLKTLMS